MSAIQLQQIADRLEQVAASTAVVENDATRAHYKARLARASRPSVRLMPTSGANGSL